MQLALQLAESPNYSLWENRLRVPNATPPIQTSCSLSICPLRWNNAGMPKISILRIREAHLDTSPYTFNEYDGAALPVTITVCLV